MSTFNQDLLNLIELKINRRGSIAERELEVFAEKYSYSMEDVMFEIYDELCPDDEIKPITAYIADHYTKNATGFDAPLDEGVVVHLDDFSFKEGRLLLLPDPARIVLQNPEKFHREILWEAA